MNEFQKLNERTGWLVFVVAAFVYIRCIEPTASFWDCGEYIACAYGLETGHPPGAPFFLLAGRFFSLFSFGNPEYVAPLINIMSALASAFTVLFLFWSITHLSRKILLKKEEDYRSTNKWLVLLAGAVGAWSYAFTDSFWFSAEEGEVYALSSLFTALVFWAMLRWEDVSEEPRADRWLVFIAYMIGLSVGVHLLNLLTIPALVFIYYFRKTPRVTIAGLLKTFLIAALLLGGLQNLVIPGVVMLAGKLELLFVNSFGAPFNTGIIVFFVLLVALISSGLIISSRRGIRWLHTSLLAFTVLLIGYSSFLVIVIRSQASTPINEGNPGDPVSLLSYLNREQYGDWPLLYGPYYNSPLDKDEPYRDGEPVYVKDEASGRYIISDDRKQSIPHYDSRGCTVFPRMYSSGHAAGYVSRANIRGESKVFETDTIMLPTFTENLRYFFSYQCGWMYGRYFLWNFVGRQNDRMGDGGETEGNWLSVPLLDNLRQGDQDKLPLAEKNNKGRNHYFFIPLLLGLAGFFWHFLRSPRDTFVTALLFIFTGLVIVLYLNQTPWQPRERDYAYVGSFYAFAIWIGFGVPAFFTLFGKYFKETVALILAAAIGFVSPLLLFTQNFDDHNRSGRTVARDAGINFLESCDKNAILFTYADNDTFPLWYAQEVLGIRRDVRIICLSLLRSDWYIDQAKRANYTSAPLPVTLTHWQYREGTRDYMNIFEETTDTLDLKVIVKRFASENPAEQFISSFGDTLNYINTRNIKMRVNKTLYPNALDSIQWRLRGNYLLKDQLIVLDMLAHNNWERPVYFAVNMPSNCYSGLDDYLQLEGLAFRLVPYKNPREEGSLMMRPHINETKCYDQVVNQFLWGGLSDLDVHADETVARMFGEPMRTTCAQIAMALAESGKSKAAIDVIRTCAAEIPASQFAPDQAWIEMVNAAYLAGDRKLAADLSRIAFDHFLEYYRWYVTLPRYTGDLGEKENALITLSLLAEESGDAALANDYREKLRLAGINVPVPDTLPDGP